MSERSKNAIAQTLLNLIETQPFNQITISELCERSPVVRKTFYNNFDTKDNIIIYIIDNKLKGFIEKIESDNILTLPHVSYLFFKFGVENREFMLLLKRNHLFLHFVHSFNRLLPRVNELLRMNSVGFQAPPHLQYIHAFHAAGVLKMLSIWLDTDMKETPEELSKIYTSIVKELD